MKKYTVLILVMVLAVTMLAGCRRGRVDNSSEATTIPTTGMTMPSITENTAPSRDTTPHTTMPQSTTVPHTTNGSHETNGTDDTHGTENSTTEAGRARTRRPY